VVAFSSKVVLLLRYWSGGGRQHPYNP